MNEYIRIFKNIFEYHINGQLNNKEYSQLMDIIYYFRFDPEKLADIKLLPKVELVWQAIKPTMQKQKQNAKDYINKVSASKIKEVEFTKILESNERKIS